MLTKEEKETFKEALDWGIETIKKIREVEDYPLMTLLEINEQQAAYLDIIRVTLEFIEKWRLEDELGRKSNKR